MQIQNVLLEVKPVENVREKIILLVSAKQNQRNRESIKYKKSYKLMGSKLIMLSGSLMKSVKSAQVVGWGRVRDVGGFWSHQ